MYCVLLKIFEKVKLVDVLKVNWCAYCRTIFPN